MEKRSDLMISTLRGYIEDMGGTQKLVVKFPDSVPVQIAGIWELGDTTPSKGNPYGVRS